MVTVDLALNVSAANGNTRMASADVNPTSLDIDGLSVLPFIVPSDQDSIRMTDAPVMAAITGFVTTSGKHYLVSDKQLNIGVNAFLCYAKAKHADPYSETNYGSLTTSESGLASKFKLTTITPPTASTVIVNYMNSIAEAAEWSTISESFNNFINLKSGTPQGLAGSSKNIIAYVNEWLDKSIPDAIKSVIRSDTYVTLDYNNKVTAINGITDSYPGAFPDGSAVIKWNSTTSKFAYESFPDYAYPAERYFYANSRIKTSASSQASVYGHTEWQGSDESTSVLANYEEDNAAVASTTRSVAIKNPLSYGVAGMEIHIKASSGTIGDYVSNAITLGEKTFPLTAVIVGSQVKQNCFFEPDDPTNQQENEYLIYDKQIAEQGVYLRTAEDIPRHKILYGGQCGTPRHRRDR